ncbi:MAG TPA: hypothetical protein PLH80_07880 [Spirochaetota bacterium]|nr:hypothetical protein [Spirochaetota bacterium]HQG42328.1 hypothetical protein [Spirochaetota bacterium]HQI38465.1 hypothetical protein [Spirochaetota bacterium]HRR61251.1 hypothetical protein [Spirochaetota bacterium]HRV15442.1 hypothetical protein [Spirochaetota bacterium]
MAFHYVKIIAVIVSLLFCSLLNAFSFLWTASSAVLAIIFLHYIPGQHRTALIMIVPLVMTIVIMQLITGIIRDSIHYYIIALTAYKIVCISIIIIGARFFIGHNGLKAFINLFPSTLRLFFLIFTRTLYTLMQHNRMIVFQLQSRINVKSKEKYYIPKYYSVAFLYNQFYAMSHFRNGILSRAITSLPVMKLADTTTIANYITVGIILLLIIINGIFQ